MNPDTVKFWIDEGPQIIGLVALGWVTFIRLRHVDTHLGAHDSHLQSHDFHNVVQDRHLRVHDVALGGLIRQQPEEGS